jgi:putative FmdB family regulatory protein
LPTYEYACKSCGRHVEVVQSFKDAPLTTCAVCAGELRKVFSPIGISFKGSGFYRTDSRSDGRGAHRDSAASSAAKDGAGSSKEGGSTREGGGSSSSSSDGSGSSSGKDGSGGSGGKDGSGGSGGKKEGAPASSSAVS